jgi:DNA primase
VSARLSDVLTEANWDLFPFQQVLSALQPRPRDLRIYCICPQCNEPDGYIVRRGRGRRDAWIQCNRKNNCGKQSSILGYLIWNTWETAAPEGAEFFQAISEFCRLVGLPPPERNQEALEHARRQQSVRDTLGVVWEIVRTGFIPDDPFSDRASAFTYLQQRGFADGFISSNFGFLSSPSDLLPVLDSTDLGEIGFWNNEHDRPNRNWENRIVIPAFDANGKIAGLIGRALEKGVEPKYYNSNQYAPARTGGFGLDTARKHKRVVLVEGPMDVLKGRQYGFTNFIAAGTSNFDVGNLLALKQYGITSVVCAFDTDEAGKRGLWSLLESSLASGATPDIYVLEGLGTKDPDEFIQDEESAAKFRELCDRAVHILRWRARHLAAEYQLPGPNARVTECAIAAAEFITKSSGDSRTELRLKTEFLTEVAIHTGVSPEDIYVMRNEVVEAEREAKLGETTRQSVSDALRQYDLEKDAGKLLGQLESIIKQSDAKTAKPKAIVIPQGELAFASVELSVQQMAQSDYIGIPNRVLTKLDNHLSGFRGFTLLAGDTGVGKTILLLQLSLDIILNNDDVCVLFLSYEMPREAVQRRAWSKLAHTSMRGLGGVYSDPPSAYAEQIEKARTDYLGFYDPRLAIWHPRETGTEHVTREMIYDQIAGLKQRTNCSRVVVIFDYADVMTAENDNEWEGTELDKQRVRLILDVRDAIGGDPVIAVTEARKRDTKNARNKLTRDDIMGSARKSYSADSVILWNRFSDKQLVERVMPNYNNTALMERMGAPPTDANEREEQVEIMRDIMTNMGIEFGLLDIDKVRDGGTKGEIEITVHHRRNFITEGIL